MGFSAPTWMTAIFGGKQLRKRGVDEVLEPWCVTFKRVLRPRVGVACHVLLPHLGVTGEQDAGKQIADVRTRTVELLIMSDK